MFPDCSYCPPASPVGMELWRTGEASLENGKGAEENRGLKETQTYAPQKVSRKSQDVRLRLRLGSPQPWLPGDGSQARGPRRSTAEEHCFWRRRGDLPSRHGHKGGNRDSSGSNRNKKKQDAPNLFLPLPLVHHHTFQKVPGRGRALSDSSLSTKRKD